MIEKSKVKSQKPKVQFFSFTVQQLTNTIFFSLPLILVCCLLFFCSCRPQKERFFRKNKILMDTFVTITVASNAQNVAESAIDKAFSEIERLEKLLDFYSPDSEISLINSRAGISEIKVSPDVLDLLTKALYVSEQTGGAFDVSVGAVSSLYDFRKKIQPDEQAIKKNLALVGYRNILISRKDYTVFLKKKGMLIDAGGIAKGYAADRAVKILKNSGIASGLVSVAGDIRTFGPKPGGPFWTIGIRNPRSQANEDDILGTVHLKDASISTSGDYERFFILNGQRYHHLLSPLTGHPAGKCRSVSVITEESTMADSFATGIFVLGPEKGMELLKNLGLEGIIVDDRGMVHATPGIRGKFGFQEAVQ